MLEKLKQIEKEALASLQAVGDNESLQQWKVKYLGRSSPLMKTFDALKELSKEERPVIGKYANQVKQALESTYDSISDRLRQSDLATTLQAERLDVTLPGRPAPRGRLHPTTQTLREIYRVFAEMGFQVYRSREVETDEYNFELLNIPPTTRRATCGTPSTPPHPGCCCARTPPRADPRHAPVLPRADPRDPAGHVLPLRAGQRPQGDPVQPGGRAGGRAETSPSAT